MPVNVRARIHDIRQATAAADGTANVIFGPVPVHCRWLVDELTTELSKGTGTAQVNHGPNANAPVFLDATRIAAANRTAPPGLELYPGESLSISFAKLSVQPPATTVLVTIRARQEPFQ